MFNRLTFLMQVTLLQSRKIVCYFHLRPMSETSFVYASMKLKHEHIIPLITSNNMILTNNCTSPLFSVNALK